MWVGSWAPDLKISILTLFKFLSLEVYRVVTLQCLTEISMIQIDGEDNAYKEKLCAMFCATIKEVGSIVFFFFFFWGAFGYVPLI